jgi:hypothetical protein
MGLILGVPDVLKHKVTDIHKDVDKFLSGMIRSDSDCIVYEHAMLNPKNSYLSEQMKFLVEECKKLQMFKGKEDYEIVNEIAAKR